VSPARARVPRSPRSPTVPPDAREAAKFLLTEIAPPLARRHRPDLVRAIHDRAADGDLARLGQLPERDRRELLEAIEKRLERRRRAIPSPGAVVRLATALLALPTPDSQIARRLASPAR
jgi:hypothetical protein